jgi:hypothetical protein
MAAVGIPLSVARWTQAWWSNLPKRQAVARPQVVVGWWVARTLMLTRPLAVTFVRVCSDSSG